MATHPEDLEEVVHYAIMNVCCSFIPACTLDWCYDMETEYTALEEEVTCEECLRFLKESSEIEEIPEEEVCSSIQEILLPTSETPTSS